MGGAIAGPFPIKLMKLWKYHLGTPAEAFARGTGMVLVGEMHHAQLARILEFAGVLAAVVTESGRSQSGGRCPT
jgi:hypothetical protein